MQTMTSPCIQEQYDIESKINNTCNKYNDEQKYSNTRIAPSIYS